MFLKVSPIRGTLRFCQKGKLACRYIGLFEVKSQINDVVYKLTLSPELLGTHDVFYVSMSKKYVTDP